MASLGDSITRGFNACGWYVDCPSRSWSTGSTTSVNSHLARLQRLGPVTAYNDAKTGAKMSALAGQAASAAAQGAQYVTVLLGANDACTGSESTMTPVATFAAQVRLRASDAEGRAGDAVRLRRLGPRHQAAVAGREGLVRPRARAWSLFGVCQSMLANPRSTTTADIARRARVQQRVRDYNAVLASACAAYGDHCATTAGPSSATRSRCARSAPGTTSTPTRPVRRRWPPSPGRRPTAGSRLTENGRRPAPRPRDAGPLPSSKAEYLRRWRRPPSRRLRPWTSTTGC